MKNWLIYIILLCCISTTEAQNARKLEIPSRLRGVPERIIEHTGYTVSFNRETNNPNWVAWELTSKEASARMDRSDSFMPDPKVPWPNQVTTNDYKGSGYDRGHMCPAADMRWSSAAMRDCFLMSNICPQDHALNAGAWEKLESSCRRWAKQEGKIYIVCGPIYKTTRKVKRIGKEHKVRVPDGFFKVVLSIRKGREKAIGFYYANNKKKQNMAEVCTSVDEIEKLTGYNFFPALEDRLERKLEATYNLSSWR